MGNQRLGWWSVAICSLPTLLPTGLDDVERTVLSPTRVDPNHDAHGSHPLPLCVVPLQFRELQTLQGALLMAEAAGRKGGNEETGRNGGRPEIKSGSKRPVDQLVPRPACTARTWHPETV